LRILAIFYIHPTEVTAKDRRKASTPWIHLAIEVNCDAFYIRGIDSDCQACAGNDCTNHEMGHSLLNGNWIWRSVRQRHLHSNLDDWFIERPWPERNVGVVYGTYQSCPQKAISQQDWIGRSSLFPRLHDRFEIWIDFLFQEAHE
jgi:hypothetical protein